MATSSSNSASYRPHQNAWPELVDITDQARELTKASGAAIALTQVNAGEVVCCARSGSGVPELGTALLVENSLTALCVESGKQLWRDNVETNAGAHSATVAELRVRSVVVTPIHRAGHVLGVLVVCAPGAGAFSELHRFLLQTTANKIAAVLGEKLRREQERVPRLLPVIEPRGTEPHVSKPKPPASARLPLPDRANRPEPPEPGVKTEAEPAGTPLDVTLHTFATFDSVSRLRKGWPARKVVLTSAVALLVIAGSATGVRMTTKGLSSHSPSNPLLKKDAVPAAGNTAGPSSALSPSHQAMLRMDPGSVAPQLGSTFMLKVVCSRGQDISNVPAQVNYDAKILQFVAVSGGEFLAQDGEQVALAHRDDPVTGTLKVNAQRPPGSAGVSGSGIVFSLAFLAKARGAATVSLAVPGASNGQSQTVSVVGSRASVTVN